jgi:hypothetical protein
MIERHSSSLTEDHKDERYPWVLPENGIHVTTFIVADMMTSLGVTEEVAATLVYEHPNAVTSYDSDTVMAGCGCGWHAKDQRPLTAAGRTKAAEDLADHLGEQVARIEFRGTSD